MTSTDRRRNLLVLLLVAGLLIASGVVIATKSTKLGLDLRGGVELNYQAQSTRFAQVNSDSLQRAIDIMRERVDQLGVSEPEIQQSGGDQINVALPDVTNAEEAQRQVGTTAQLFFFDWEPNVIGPDGKTQKANFDVTGGPQAGTAGAISHYDAVIRASKVPAHRTQNPSADGAQYYIVQDNAKGGGGTVVDGPEDSRAEAIKSLPRQTLGQRQRVVTIQPGTTIVQAESPTSLSGNAEQSSQGPDAYYVLNDNYALRGTDIKDPEQQFDSGTGGSGEPNVTFNFTSKGRSIWQQVTREIAQRGQSFVPSSGQPLDPASKNQHFAIVLDGQLISVPYIDYVQNPDGIDAANGSQISGSFTIKSAQRLANLLKTGALPIRLELISQSQVSATLGQQALDQGVLALIVGFAVVAVFLIAFYRVLGLVAVLALVLYGVYLFALIKAIPVVLTLPGFAGLVLTIGVCADANIVIFERIKEEVAKGRSVRQSIAQGYKKGLSTIIDANVVTLLTAFVLFVLATSNVRGFALTLGLGTLVTLFSAVLATQAIVNLTGARTMTNPSLVGAREGRVKKQFDFNKYTKVFFSASGIILAAGAFAIATKGLDFGIDFSSGTRIAVAFDRPVTNDQVNQVLERNGVDSPEVQRVTNSPQGANAVQISTSELRPDEVTQVTGALDQAFGVRGSPQTTSIGPTFGASIARSAAIAVVVSLLLIAVYVALRFEWKYAATTAISLAHDLLITGGLYAITGKEVTSGTVAALLTVLGFSLYDTIIVSDRMRENSPRMPWATFSQISNRSMNEVIVRSLTTVVCTCLPIVALYIVGGDTLKDFAFALLVGTISGAYSSIFISSPVLTEWKEREPQFRRRRARQAEQYGGDVPHFAPERGDVEPTRERPKPASRRLTGPEDPERRVSQREFDQMVDDLGLEEARGRTATTTRERTPRPRPQEPAAPAPERDSRADATPEDLVMKDDRKPRKPRNKRHGRPR